MMGLLAGSDSGSATIAKIRSHIALEVTSSKRKKSVYYTFSFFFKSIFVG
jgi:hypothetical protein